MNSAAIEPELLQAAEAALPDDALSEVRQAAVQAYERLPTLRDEDWRYTNLASAAEISNDWLTRIAERSEVPVEPAASAALPAIDAHWLVLRNGTVDATALAALPEIAGLAVTRLAGHSDHIAVGDAPFDQLNAALLRDGLYLRVADGAVIDKPVALLFDDGGSTVGNARIVIEVGANARIELVEYHRSSGATPHFANTVTKLALGPGSRAGFLRWQDRDRRHHQVGKLDVHLSRDATLDCASFDFGGALIRQDVNADIAGPGATVNLHGLYFAGGTQHIDNHTRVDHHAGQATSREEYRGILAGKTRCVWNGKAIVHKGADGTDAEQANHNLLLSAHAEVDTKPELEIYADDVKCSHGATVGQLDETALYYLRARGIDRDQASHMLTRAFAATVLAHLSNDALRQPVAARVDARLDELLEETAA